jgi:hypothetical protein
MKRRKPKAQRQELQVRVLLTVDQKRDLMNAAPAVAKG